MSSRHTRARSSSQVPQTQAPQASGNSSKNYNSRAGVAALKKRERLSSGNIPVTAQSTQGQEASHPSIEQPEVEYEAEDPAHVFEEEVPGDAARVSEPPSSSYRHVLTLYKAAKADQNKENLPKEAEQPRKRSFIEPQANAERVEFDEHGYEPPTEPQRPKKRGRRTRNAAPIPEEEQDPQIEDEEAGFEADLRSPGRADGRRIASGPAFRPANIQPNLEEAEEEEEEEEEAPVARMAPRAPATQPKLVSSQVPHKPQHRPPPGIPSYDDISDIAKNYTSVFVAQQREAKPQSRRPWSSESTQRLIGYIGIHGTKWSEIAKLNDPLLEGRDQVALKDKARNVKVEYRKSGAALPPNFNFVSINTAQKRRLLEMGIPPEDAV